MSDTGTGRGAFFKEFAIILLKFLVFFCVPLALLELVIGDTNEAIWTVITVIGLILFGGWYYDELTALIWPSWFLCVGLTFAWASIAYLTGHIKESLGLLFLTIPISIICLRFFWKKAAHYPNGDDDDDDIASSNEPHSEPISDNLAMKEIEPKQKLTEQAVTQLINENTDTVSVPDAASSYVVSGNTEEEIKSQTLADEEPIFEEEAITEGVSTEQWVSSQMEQYGFRHEELSAALKSEIEEYDGAKRGLEGQILRQLMDSIPCMFLVEYWGGSKGFQSGKRSERWRKLMERRDIETDGHPYLLKFRVNAQEWVPHPYSPPVWAVSSFKSFSSSFINDEKAFDICRNWHKENGAKAQSIIDAKLEGLGVSASASFRIEPMGERTRKVSGISNLSMKMRFGPNSGETLEVGKDKPALKTKFADFVYVALSVPHTQPDLLNEIQIWKSESELASLVLEKYPDAVREHSPPWLGQQRLDIFIPSLNVAIEYQGEQHYRPVSLFGGEEAHKKIKERDERKRRLCRENGLVLVEWEYSTAITQTNLDAKLKEAGLTPQ